MIRLRRWLLLGLLLPLLVATRLQGDEAHQAAIVVRIDEERAETRCVSFAEETISGHELLQRSGLEVIVSASSAGVFVCSMEGQGCPASDCLCQCQGEPCTYWSYWRGRDGDWQYAGVGAAGTEVRHGDVDGWSWGPGSVTSAIAPPAATFDEVCAAAPGETASQNVQVGDDATPEAAPGWLPYAGFAVVVILLAGAYVWTRRGSGQ